MKQSDIDILAEHGWTLMLVNPLTVAHTDGSIMSGEDSIKSYISYWHDFSKKKPEYSKMTIQELEDWREEVISQHKTQMRILSDRLDSEDPMDHGLGLSRCELAGNIACLDTVNSVLGQVIRGKRL